MGEKKYHVTDLPTAPRPEVHWDGSVPAEALADLVEEFGFRVVLQLDGTVKICKAGDGADLPIDDDVMENSLTIDPRPMPDDLAILCGDCRFQADLRA